MSSALWLVVWRRSGLAMLANPRTFVYGAGGCRSPGFVLSCPCPGSRATGAPILLYFLLLVSVPIILGPYRLVPRPMFVPKRRSQQGVVNSRAVTTFLLETPPFIGPNSLSLDNYISCDQYITSGAGFLVPSYKHFQY